jgi:hypothetical protein
MRTFYFVGGPTPGHAEAFFDRLEAAGGPPPGWHIYRHVSADGKALHIVQAESDESITSHLAQFADIYHATKPIEVSDGNSTPTQFAKEQAHTAT